jgi:hypothetical protein
MCDRNDLLALMALKLPAVGGDDGLSARVCTQMTARDSLASIFLIRGQANARGIVLAE